MTTGAATVLRDCATCISPFEQNHTYRRQGCVHHLQIDHACVDLVGETREGALGQCVLPTEGAVGTVYDH